MRLLTSLGCLGLLAGLSACDSDELSGGAADVPDVGDTVDDGKVTHVAGDEECRMVTVTHSAEWSCSDEQQQRVRGDFIGEAEDTAAPAGPTPATVELAATDCEGLAALRRPALKSAQQSNLDRNYRVILADKCVGKTTTRYYSGGKSVPYCQNYNNGGGWATGGTASSGPFPSGQPDTPATDDGASEYSTTNTQVVGVDEADFVKNDAGNAYVLSSQGLHVIDAWPAPETKEIKRIALPGEPRRLYLAGDKLLVYTRLGVGTGGSAPSAQGCTYGYDCRFSAEPGQTQVIVFDVSEPSAPKELRRFGFSGGYVDSRRVGNYVYTVVQDGDSVSLPGVDLTLNATSPAKLEAQYAARRKSADDAVDTAPAQSFLPWIHGLDSAGNVDETLDACDNALASQAAAGRSFISLVSLDLKTLTPPSRTLIAGKPGYVYSSADALYMTTDGVDGSDSIYRSSSAQDQSTVHKFALDGLSTTYRGSAAIPGHVLNQFSMDEHEGVLRVATSSGWVPSPDVSSNLVTLAEQGGGFARLGSIGGIAPTEDIRSVRFDGERAFVVTFKKTDPLFVFDLADPTTPKILGELKIPGFSTYMHPMDANHLLAIGFDADDQGSFAYFDGIQLQIFDVTELSEPKLLHKHVIGTRGSASEALTNHLAFNYFPSKGLLALPMTVCEGGDNGVYGDVMSFSGLMVFDVSLESGITEHGKMSFVDPSSVTQGCGTWWTSSKSDVKRSIFMDDYAIGISDSKYQVASLSKLDDVLQSLPLGN
jgi:uncharacterized secreted protein with C-terminal beta-propeller domain